MPLHHIVPKMLLRRFAKNEKTLQVVSREDFSRTRKGSVDKAAAETGFYNIPTDDIDPKAQEKHDPEGIEAALSTIEAKTSPILTSISKGTMPAQDEDRFWLSFFVATQITRGWQYREMVSTLGNTVAKQHFDARNEQLHERARDYLGSLGEPNGPREVTDYIDMVRNASWKLLPNKSRLIQESLKQAWFPLGPALLSRPLRIFRFDNPSLLTSDAAVGLWAPDSDEPRSVGVGNARGVFMAIDRFTAVGFMSRGENRDVAGSPFWAQHINLSIADRASKWVYHHPDDDPLSKITLPPPAKLLAVYDTETKLDDGRVKLSGRHVWR